MLRFKSFRGGLRLKLLSSLVFVSLASAFGLNPSYNFYPSYNNYLENRAEILKGGNFYFKGDTKEKVVALSFDDGPNKKTKAIMRVLKEHNAPATFFLMGKNINRKNYKLFQDPLFSVGMHTFSHKNYEKMTLFEIEKDIDRTIAIFQKYNLDYSLFRPAYGVVTRNLDIALRDRGVKAILWSNDTMDWDRKRRDYERVIDNLSNGDIILMHDHATKPEELDTLLKQIENKGFKIVPIEYLLNR